ncbi:MAG: efflux RND transporter periplasmic adaptor subunit [Proteobacteria bacterium]|nr:efflux RND transporter periplasmic adaptor subunit [Pseudomonadota bacterium]
MKKINLIALFVVVAAGSFLLGNHQADHSKSQTVNGKPETGSRKPQTENRKLLYYRNPMGLPDTSPVPKKDSMGMDYVAVYQGDEAGEDGAVSISVAKVQKLGVKSEAAMLRSLNRTLHATGRIEVDERRTYAIAPKFEGWVERLYLNSTGQTVSKGQPLFDVYSPELVSAQREYAIAAQGEAKLANADEETKAGMKQLADASLARLKNWDITPGELRQLTDGKSRRNLTYYAPVSGIVLEKKAVQGMRFMPGETLYQIADLSSVWVLADISEQDIALIKAGGKAKVNIAAFPDKTFEGKITFIYPTLNPATRTVQVRVEMANTDGQLRPAMFANVTLPVGNNARVLTVPTSAVIDSGTRQIVLVQRAEGRYTPRTVKLGHRNNDYVEVLDGIREGELVVTSALFLIDAESNLKAALAGLGTPASASPADVGRDLSRQVGLKPDLPIKTVGHQANGVFNAINEDGSANITHEAIKTLGWPGMTMDFALANASLAAGVRRKPDEWVITKLQARLPHEGH